jgi:hypothetical protein
MYRIFESTQTCNARVWKRPPVIDVRVFFSALAERAFRGFIRKPWKKYPVNPVNPVKK